MEITKAKHVFNQSIQTNIILIPKNKHYYSHMSSGHNMKVKKGKKEPIEVG